MLLALSNRIAAFCVSVWASLPGKIYENNKSFAIRGLKNDTGFKPRPGPGELTMHPSFVVRPGFLDAASQLLTQAVQSNRGFGQHLAKSSARLVQLQFQSVDGVRGVVQLFQLCHGRV